MKPSRSSTHPLDVHPSFRAVISAAPAVAELARQLPHGDDDLVKRLAVACGDLVHGFHAPPGSIARNAAHHRAWVAVRELDRSVMAVRINRLAPARVVAKAQRAIDRADVMIGALLPD
jgi:hypothetical protein